MIQEGTNMPKNRNNKIPYDIKELENILHVNPYADLDEKARAEILQKDPDKLTAQERIAKAMIVNTPSPVIGVEDVSAEEREDYERLKEGRLIDKLDAGFGSKS